MPKHLRPPVRLAVLGAINWDTTVFVEGFAEPGQEVPATALEEGPGGKGANAAVAAARILGRGSVAFLGALGDDPAAGPLLDSLEAEGVSASGVVRLGGVSSGRAIIVVDRSGGKTIHTHFGANDRYLPEHLRSGAASALLEAAATVVIMDLPVQTALAAAGAVGPRARVIYSPGVRASSRPLDLEKVLSEADDLVLDRSELAMVSGTGDPRKGVAAIRRSSPHLTVVATLGPEGALVSSKSGSTPVAPVDLADLAMRPVNSTGSGDAFLAAYACYSMKGLPPEVAASWGNLAGALKAASHATRGSPAGGELERRMASLKRVRGRPRA